MLEELREFYRELRQAALELREIGCELLEMGRDVLAEGDLVGHLLAWLEVASGRVVLD